MTALGPVADFRLRDIALAAYGPSALASIGAGAATPVIVLQARDLGASVATAAFVVALLGLGSLVTSLPAGALVARIGERMALVLAGIVDALAMAGAALSTSVGSLGVAVAVTGGAGTVFLLARQGFVIDAVPVSHRARALSALGGAHRSGLFFGPLIAGVGRPPHRGRQRAGVGGGDDPGRRHRPDRRPGPVSRRVAGGGCSATSAPPSVRSWSVPWPPSPRSAWRAQSSGECWGSVPGGWRCGRAGSTRSVGWNGLISTPEPNGLTSAHQKSVRQATARTTG